MKKYISIKGNVCTVLVGEKEGLRLDIETLPEITEDQPIDILCSSILLRNIGNVTAYIRIGAGQYTISPGESWSVGVSGQAEAYISETISITFGSTTGITNPVKKLERMQTSYKITKI